MRKLLATIALAGGLGLAGAGLLALPGGADGAPPSGASAVTLAVDNLKGNCPSCVFILDRTLSRLDGVSRVEVSQRTGTVTVTYDAAATEVAALTSATAAAGFPSRPVE